MFLVQKNCIFPDLFADENILVCTVPRKVSSCKKVLSLILMERSLMRRIFLCIKVALAFKVPLRLVSGFLAYSQILFFASGALGA